MHIKTTCRRSIKTGWKISRLILFVVLFSITIGGSQLSSANLNAQVRSFTRPVEFEFAGWTLTAMFAKLSGWGLNLENFLTQQAQSNLVQMYINQLQLVNTLNAEIFILYADPNVTASDLASQELRQKLQVESRRLSALAPLAEGVLQSQLMSVLAENQLGYLGQVLPPSLFVITDIPQSLIISPRTEIYREMDIPLNPGLSVDFKERLEDEIFNELNRSALVVPIGGIGTYPTMVMQSTDLLWLTDTIAHEWVHNFLSLRPLGINYFSNAEMRTINETTASLAGSELGWLIMEKYYPEHIPPYAIHPRALIAPTQGINNLTDSHAFSFQREMRQTRVEADRLLAAGDILAAEAFMEARRQFFWENGYQIRKINQAYFAFYGAYSDDPAGGAAGEDPVGLAVQALYGKYPQLADFLNKISWVTSFEGLITLLED